MANRGAAGATTESNDVTRNAETIAARLHTRGLSLDGTESPDQLLRMVEAVEDFEFAVSAHGGDLMVDEAPRGRVAEPDDVHFALPLREDGMTVSDYLEKLARATDVVRHHAGPRGD